MAHKGLKGRRSATKSTLKAGINDAKKKLKKKQSQKAKNPEAGLKKWEKKALRAQNGQAAKPQEDAEIVDTSRGKKLRPRAEKVAPVEVKRKAGAEVEDGKSKKLAKKEARHKAILEKQHKQLYAAGERILLVGEGNFSFAKSLCEHLGSGKNVYATAFDTEASLNRKYTDAAACRKEIEETLGGTTLVGVDAAKLHRVKEFRGAFKTVLWNFPHMGSGEKDVEKSIEQHRELLLGFFKSAAQCLDPGQTTSIHVAMKNGEPYKSWRIVQVAKAAAADLQMQTVVPFALHAWPGYEHRRTKGFEERFSKKDSEELAKGAKVYVFSQGKQDESGDDEEDE